MPTPPMSLRLVSSRESGNGEEIIPSFWMENLPAKRGKRRGPGATARPASPSFTGDKGYYRTSHKVRRPVNADVR